MIKEQIKIKLLANNVGVFKLTTILIANPVKPTPTPKGHNVGDILNRL